MIVLAWEVYLNKMKILDYFKTSSKEENNFNLLPDGIFTLEQDGKVVDVNNKVLEMYGISRFEILGRYFSDFIENGTSVLNKIVKSNTSMTARAIMKDEEVRNVYFDISATRNAETSKVYDVHERI